MYLCVISRALRTARFDPNRGPTGPGAGHAARPHDPAVPDQQVPLREAAPSPTGTEGRQSKGHRVRLLQGVNRKLRDGGATHLRHVQELLSDVIR